MALGRILRSSASGTPSLVEVISRAAARSETVLPMTAGELVRVSQLHSLCPRQEVLLRIHNVTSQDTISSDLGVTFALGTGMHHAMQNLLLGPAGVLEGQWRCMECGGKHGYPAKGARDARQFEARVSMPVACAHCAASQRSLVLDEYYLEDRELGLCGHPDGLLRLPGLSLDPVLLEGKSIAQSQVWKIKDAPLWDHVVQVHGYMMLSGLTRAIVLYWVKGVHGTSAFKEFVVERDDDLVAQLTDSLSRLRKGLHDGVVTDALVRVCATHDCDVAMSCPVRAQCFAGYVPEPDGAVGLF